MTPLVARQQLSFVETLAGLFGTRSSTARPVVEVQALYVALTALLRSVGHVFEKVDCDSPERKAWAKERWDAWKAEPIFAEFIELNRNVLLKEFRGLEQLGIAMAPPAFVYNLSVPGDVDAVASFEPDKFLGTGGEPVLARVQKAISFWDRHLKEAEGAFAQMPSRRP